jgi:hypothetical protein
MTTKMQQLLDLIVNEEMDKANELFHEIVVEKSREIYENLISEEEDETEMDEASEEEDESVDEASEEEEEDESVDEGFGADETEMNVGDEPDADPADALMHDTEVGGDDMGGEEDGGAPATKDDVQDLEDALAELKAEFEALMGGSGEEADDEFGGEEDGEEADDEFGGEEDGEEADDEEDDQDESMGVVREYREKVGNDWQGNAQKAQGKSLGANSGESYPAPVEGKSPISSGKGKPTTGANANNILAKSEGEGTNTGTSPNADKGSRGLAGSTKGEFTNGVTVNKNGSTTGVKTLSKVAGGHGAEKKGSAPGPVGSGSGDKAGQTSVGQAKSPLNGAPNRNA